MRQSMAPGRQSQLPSQAANVAAQTKLLEKKKECEAVMALKRASANFVRRIEALGDDFDVMADAGVGELLFRSSLRTLFIIREVHGQVLEQWPNMFRILDLFCMFISTSFL